MKAALATIAAAFADFRPALCFSGGRDSLVLLDLVFRHTPHRPPVVYVHNDLMRPATRQFVRECAASYGAELTDAIADLRPCPDNYRSHPPEQLEHLKASLAQYGWARNVVVSADGMILAGHGIVQAAQDMGMTEVPVHRLEYGSDDPRAIKFLALENTVSRLAEDDETQLAALLADVQRTEGLDGTGYDEADLDSMLGSMDEHAWDPNAGAKQATGKDLARRWFVGFVLEQEAKQALGDVLAEEALGNEKPHETLARLIIERVVRKH